MKSTLYGWGINDADYPIKTRVNGKCVIVPEYSRWISVVQRSNDPKEKARKPSYQDVYCSPKWKHFTDFSAWLHTQAYWQELQLDKDILFPGNKEYGPDTCCFIPIYINALFQIPLVKNQYLLGVSKTKHGNYTARTTNRFTGEHCLGTYKTMEEAHAAWQIGKAYVLECAVSQYATEKWFRTDVADAIMSRVWKLRLDAFNGVPTTTL
ncbi:MAG: hypothetical protein EOO06_00845 [Chitinophagaceae bacterium]|nr:MAG: hypothetical protein EOO06_00845 [Chitinophagaceae bacterium]